MRRAFLSVVVSLVLIATSSAQVPIIGGGIIKTAGGGGGGGGCTPNLLNESFTTGSAPSGWSGTAEYNYTTSPAPLEGTKSVHVEADETANYDKGSEQTGEQWLKFIHHPLTLPSSFAHIHRGLDASFNITWRITLNSSGTLTANNQDGSVFASTASGMSAGTTYYVFGRYKPSTGSNNGELEVWFNTSDSRSGTPANNHVAATTGSYTGGIRYFQFSDAGTGPQPYILDLAQWSSTDCWA